MTKTGKSSDLKLSLCKTCGCMTITKLVYIGTDFINDVAICQRECGKCGAKKRD